MSEEQEYRHNIKMQLKKMEVVTGWNGAECDGLKLHLFQSDLD